MSKFTSFYFNGREYSVTVSVTITDLINYFGYKSVLFVVEYNNYICNQCECNEILINDNDKIELITIVGGG